MTDQIENIKNDRILEIHDLMQAYNISINDLMRLEKNVSEIKNQNALSKIFGYIGGVFIFGGFATLIGMLWDDLSVILQIILSFGVGLLLFIFAAQTSETTKYARFSTAFFLISAVLQPLGLLTFLDAYSSGDNPQYAILLICAYMVTQATVTFFAKKQTSLLFIALTFGTCFFATAFDLLKVDGEFSAMIIGLSHLLICYKLSNSQHRPITGFWYFVGAILLLGGFFSLVGNTPIEVLFIGITGLLIALSVKVRSRALLLVGVIALLSYISYFTAKHFADVLSWPICLILLGFAFFGLSKFALRLNAQIKAT